LGDGESGTRTLGFRNVQGAQPENRIVLESVSFSALPGTVALTTKSGDAM
jgi:hypothetical protein